MLEWCRGATNCLLADQKGVSSAQLVWDVLNTYSEANTREVNRLFWFRDEDDGDDGDDWGDEDDWSDDDDWDEDW